MATATEATTSGLAEPKAAAGKKGRGSRRRRGSKRSEPSTARFFLIKASGNGTGSSLVRRSRRRTRRWLIVPRERQLRRGYGVEGHRRCRDGRTRHQEGGSQAEKKVAHS